MSPVDKKKKSRLETLIKLIPIWVQIIICIGGIAAVIAPLAWQTVFSESAPTAAPLKGDPVFIPTATATALQSVEPTILPASDWDEDCIDFRVWIPFLAGQGAQGHVACHELSQYGITAENGKLIFVSNISEFSAVEHGIFTPWQQWKKIDFTVSRKYLENSEIWIGFFEADTTKSKGLVFVIQPGDNIDVRELPREDYPVDNTYLPFADGEFNVEITFYGGKARFFVDGQGIISDWPVSFTIKNMFIGYRSLLNADIDASISNLEFIKP